jgi:hypothetical protein
MSGCDSNSQPASQSVSQSVSSSIKQSAGSVHLSNGHFLVVYVVLDSTYIPNTNPLECYYKGYPTCTMSRKILRKPNFCVSRNSCCNIRTKYVCLCMFEFCRRTGKHVKHKKTLKTFTVGTEKLTFIKTKIFYMLYLNPCAILTH